MAKRITLLLALLLILGGAIGCAKEEVVPTAAPEPTALSISGEVDSPSGWSVSQLQDMPATSADFVNKDGETDTYTGVAISMLLDEAKAKSGASTLSFVADDGYASDADLAEVLGVENGIVAIEEDGGLRVVLPGLSNKVQVKGLVEIQVE